MAKVELKGRSELSSYLNMNQLLTKSLLLSCASFYEAEITSTVKDILRSGQLNESVSNFLERSAVEGQFYKWFDFRGAKNTNPFLSKFGSDFKEKMRAAIDKRQMRQIAEARLWPFLKNCNSFNIKCLRASQETARGLSCSVSALLTPSNFLPS